MTESVDPVIRKHLLSANCVLGSFQYEQDCCPEANLVRRGGKGREANNMPMNP